MQDVANGTASYYVGDGPTNYGTYTYPHPLISYFTGGGNPPNLYDVDMETGDTGQFTTTEVDSGNGFAAESNDPPAKTGNYGLTLSLGGTNGNADGYKTIANENDIYIGVHVRYSSNLSLPLYRTVNLITLLDTNYSEVFTFRLENANNANNGLPDNWRYSGQNLAGNRSTTNLTPDTWHWVVAHWTRGTGPDGGIEVWIDGSRVFSELTTDQTGETLMRVYYGAICPGTSPFPSGTLYADDMMASTAQITEP